MLLVSRVFEVLIYLGENVPVGGKKILKTVIVEIQEKCAPSKKLGDCRTTHTPLGDGKTTHTPFGGWQLKFRP